ncbi:DUF3231 family protein [Bacillus massilinigeriensis]|uniref:DUF3231 family protein n=1 Tax=Bacillus massilionigeriensis TaxID=1805475 RepID=UPI00096AEDEA|nr:DUF3231 family protein [Bacillus massilionigeriensis]
MDTRKTIKVAKPKPSPNNEPLTSAEVGKLWSIYMGNTMSIQILSYFLKHVDDDEIQKLLDQGLHLSQSFVESSKDILEKEKFPIPVGFTEKDVNLEAPRLFSDEFYLHYLKYAGKAGLSLYSIAVPLMIREDIADFLNQCVSSTVDFLRDVNHALITKGFLMKPPPIPVPERVEFIKKQNYLNGFFGNVRPLHVLEITHLYDNIENNVTSKALLIGFSQVSQHETVRQYLIRGKEITNKHIELCSQHLHKDHLPSPPLLDHLVTTSTSSPFSEKLMLFHKIDMFSMKIRSYGNSSSANGRRDIGGMYAKFLMDMALFVEDGFEIMIDYGWMEQIPEAVDRDTLASKK